MCSDMSVEAAVMKLRVLLGCPGDKATKYERAKRKLVVAHRGEISTSVTALSRLWHCTS